VDHDRLGVDQLRGPNFYILNIPEIHLKGPEITLSWVYSDVFRELLLLILGRVNHLYPPSH
jgi:hypothetical protein